MAVPGLSGVSAGPFPSTFKGFCEAQHDALLCQRLCHLCQRKAPCPCPALICPTRSCEHRVRVEYALGGPAFRMLRLAYLPPGRPASVGPMACSPQRSGFVATFRDFQVGPPIRRELHSPE